MLHSLPYPQIAGLAIFCILMATAALQDIVQMKISDIIPVALIAMFAVTPLPEPVTWAGAGWRIAIALAIFFAFAGVNFFNLMAGGDVKLITAASLWFEPGYGTFTFVVLTTVCGGLLALAHIALRALPLPVALHRLAWIGAIQAGQNVIPYGVGIAIGGVVAQFILLEQLGR
ncbi:prepilin peptidase [Camelimonas fluminis]|uniref:Prepilin peptidase n=1 Tax=Camelimonas fluminis TaxID=1576911 RepID=A0ABV7UH02_9HYPH|nr:prepilin peptidase [Camelimonas fluminis]